MKNTTVQNMETNTRTQEQESKKKLAEHIAELKKKAEIEILLK